MPRWLRWLWSVAIVVVLVGVPLGYWCYRDTYFRNVHVVHEGVLYRSGQLPLAGLKRLIHDHGIKTVISLRDAHKPGDEPPDIAEESYCKKNGYYFYRIPVKQWEAAQGRPRADQSVAQFRAIMNNPAHFPVLIHCFAGIHRTGAFVAIYRMEFDGWPNARAIAELKANGYHNLDQETDVLGYLEKYRPAGPASSRPLLVLPVSFPRHR